MVNLMVAPSYPAWKQAKSLVHISDFFEVHAASQGAQEYSIAQSILESYHRLIYTWTLPKLHARPTLLTFMTLQK